MVTKEAFLNTSTNLKQESRIYFSLGRRDIQCHSHYSHQSYWLLFIFHICCCCVSISYIFVGGKTNKMSYTECCNVLLCPSLLLYTRSCSIDKTSSERWFIQNPTHFKDVPQDYLKNLLIFSTLFKL